MSITAPDPTIDFVGLFADQTEDTILNRMIDWANEGLDPVANADEWIDTREGGHWRTCITPCVRELARLYDLAGTEVPMSAFVLWAWGTYLDDLAEQYDVERKAATFATGQVTFTGPAGTDIALDTTVGTVPAGPNDPAPTFHVTTEGIIPDAGSGSGALILPIQADDAGIAGNVAAGAIVAPSTPLHSGVAFANAAATGGGSDPETDESLRTRVLEAIVGRGPGAQADYIRWASQWPGVGSAKVVPTPSGPNSVLVTITDPEGQPLPSDIVTALQNDLDPVPGKGAGTAPVGAQVTVDTPTPLPITVVVSGVTYETGYSSDGTGATIAVHDDIATAIKNYLLTLLPGGTVVLAHIAGLIATWPGIHDFAAVTLNGSAANVAIGLTPPQTPTLALLTLP